MQTSVCISPDNLPSPVVNAMAFGLDGHIPFGRGSLHCFTLFFFALQVLLSSVLLDSSLE